MEIRKMINKIFRTKPDIKKAIKEERLIDVVALDTYYRFKKKDNELGRIPKAGETFKVTPERFKILTGNNPEKRIYVRRLR